MCPGSGKIVKGVHSTAKFSRSQSNLSSVGCAGQTDLIHGNPILQLTALWKFAGHVLVPQHTFRVLVESMLPYTRGDLAAKRGHILNVFIHWQQKLDLKTVILMLSWSFPCFPSVKVTILRHDDHRHPSPKCSHQDNDVHSVQRGVQGLQPVHCLYGVTRGAQSWNGKGKWMCL